MAATLNHCVYLGFGILFTIFVGQSLYHHGRPFLIDCLKGNERAADSINRLLLTGFYLMNLGLMALAIRFGETGTNLVESFEHLGTRIGVTLIVMGLMHLQNLIVLSWLRQNRRGANDGDSPSTSFPVREPS